MYKKKIILYAIISILAISGFNGYLIEIGLLNINQSILNLLLDAFLLIVAFFSIKNNTQIRTHLFVFLIFIFITIFTYILNVNELTPLIYFNGLREFIPYFLFPIIYLNLFQSRWRHIWIKNFDRFLYVFLALQIPVTLYQFSIHGTGDMVGGTQGEGFSGILTFTVFLGTYYLMTQGFDEQHLVKSVAKKSYLLIFWLPAFINETKISFILIPLFLFLLVKFAVSNIPKYIYILLIMVPSLFFFNYIYQRIATDFDSNDFLTAEFLQEYLASDNEQYDDVPRFEKLAFFMNNFDQQEILFGQGIGQFKGGTTLDLTPFAARYEWLLQGSVPMVFFLLIQVGIAGVLVFLAYWIIMISFRPIIQKDNYSNNLIIYSTVCFIIIQLYNDSLRSLFFCGIITYIMCYAISPTRPHKRLTSPTISANTIKHRSIKA